MTLELLMEVIGGLLASKCQSTVVSMCEVLSCSLVVNPDVALVGLASLKALF